MARFFKTLLVVAFIGVSTAEPARFRNLRTNSASARQEVASDGAPAAKAPYPPAGLRPDIPFDLPTETTTTPPDNIYLAPETTTSQPDNTYLPPDSTYGTPTTTYEPPTTTYEPPTTTYGTPTTTLEPEFATEESDILLEANDDDDDTESVISVAISYDTDTPPEEPQRLVFGQRIQPLKSARLQRMRAVEPIFLDDGSLAYSV